MPSVSPEVVRALAGNQATGSLTAWEPSLRDRIAYFLSDAAGHLGAGRYAQQDIAQKTRDVIDFIPGVGDVLGVDDAVRDYQVGNYGMAAAGLGLAALGAVPGAGDALASAAKKGIRAFHGSPHNFDRFDISKIGTGEGAQAYGHGLYFAENENVARSYRDDLTAAIDTPQMRAAKILELHGGDVDKALDYMGQRIEEAYARGDIDRATNSLAVRAALLTPKNLPSTAGHMYEVRIHADPERLLDWDDGGREVWEKLRSQHGSQGAADVLRQSGVPGIKYLDAGSRGVGDGTRNYVVFDDNLIEIVRKYGLAGAVALGLISQEMADQMAAQGLVEGNHNGRTR